jgi:outer membrane protein assembly factor BamB
MKTRTGYVVALTLMACLAPLAFAQSADTLGAAAETWTASFSKDVNWQMLTDAGFLMVCTDDALYGVNPETGVTAWTNEDLKKITEDLVDLIETTPYAVITKKSGGTRSELVMMDVISGQTLWTSKDLGLHNSNGHMLYRPASALIMYGKDEDSGKMKTIMADLVTGKPIWTSETLFEKKPAMFPLKTTGLLKREGIIGNQPPVVLPDGNFLECWSKAGLRKIDVKTGNVIWTSPLEIDNVPAPRSGYAQIQLSPDSQIAYIPHDRTVDAVRLSDGKFLWMNGPKLKSKVVQMQVTPQGLIVRGAMRKTSKGMSLNAVTGKMEDKSDISAPYLTVIDLPTGQEKWKDPFTKLYYPTSFAVADDKVLIYDGNTWMLQSLMQFNIADGEMTKIVKKVGFKGSEYPDSLEIVNGNFLLMSPQNLKMFDREGKTVFHTYHDGPGSGLLKAVGQYWGPSMETSFLTPLGNVVDINASLQPKAERMLTNPVMDKRFKALAHARNFVTMQAKVGSGKDVSPGLVKIDKTTGRDIASIALGKKNPEFLLDGIENRLFYKKDDRTIVCYSF